MKKIGIFAGTFDPVHEGHLAFAREACQQQALDKVLFLVEPRPRRKQAVKAFEHRVAMVQLAIADEPRFGSIVLNAARFSVNETLPILQSRFKGAKLYMLFGEDVLNHLAEWPHVDELLRSTGFIIGLRKLSKNDVEQRIKTIQTTRGMFFEYQMFKAAYSEFSSSGIRLQLKQGHDPAGLPKTVLEYVHQHRLYSSVSSE